MFRSIAKINNKHGGKKNKNIFDFKFLSNIKIFLLIINLKKLTKKNIDNKKHKNKLKKPCVP